MARARKRPTTGRSLARWALQLALPLAAAVAVLAGVLWLGRLARQGERTVAFTDIACEPPPGQPRAEFLEEAQYRAGLPPALDLDDAGTAERVRSALAAHPWVASVREVRVSEGVVRADLDFREPLLWVALRGRAVDASGLLLPVSASRKGLPVLGGEVKPPAGQPGQPWGDPSVEAAVKVLAWLRPRRKAIDLGDAGVSVTGGEVTLWPKGRRVIWGRPPGDERPGEPDAEAKATRLVTQNGDLDLRR